MKGPEKSITQATMTQMYLTERLNQKSLSHRGGH